MKKLLALTGVFFLMVVAVVSANPTALLLTTPAAWSNFTILGNAVDVAAITAYADEHKRTIISTMVNGMDIAKDITVIPNVKNKIQLTKLRVGDGARPYVTAHEPKAGSLIFSDRELATSTGKRDLLIDHRDFKNKHLAWRTRPGNSANKNFNDMEFAPYTWDQILKGLQRELNDETAYFGFDKSTAVAYSEASTYANNAIVTFTVNGVLEYFQNISGSTTTAGQDPLDTPAKWRNVTARAITPGIRTHIDALIAGGFAVTTTGAVTDAATALSAFKTIFRSMPIPYQRWGVIVHASVTDCQFLLDALGTRTQYVSEDTKAMIAMGMIPIPETMGKGWAKPATWLGTSRRLIAEPMEMGQNYGLNLVMGTDLLSDVNEIKIVPDVYALKCGITFELGFQIQDSEALRLGNQA
ncbi:MAG: hypothetical protein O9302_00315 [Cyclobacteriaceae bacterium]|jgi:hypothetical protein|nr:hypothetical protein [Cytophagales bacterium]MCZ8326474.1 hypothetical protein [Cyclobacteriaceae bacterium]